MVVAGGLEEELRARETLEREWLTTDGREEKACVVGGLGSVWYTIRRWEDELRVVGRLKTDVAPGGFEDEELGAEWTLGSEMVSSGGWEEIPGASYTMHEQENKTYGYYVYSKA